MGSPWPWTQEPVKSNSGTSITSMQNNNNNNNSTNNKRFNYTFNTHSSYPSFYNNNQHNHEFHQNPVLQQHIQTNNQRFSPSSPASPLVVAAADQEPLQRRRSSNPHLHQPFVTHDHMQHSQQHPYHPHYHHQVKNSNGSFRKHLSSGTSSSTLQSQFATVVSKIPTWNIYYSDQKHRMIDFTDKKNSIRPDSTINQLVSLCFVDTCITNLAVDAIVNSTTQDYSGVAGVDRLINQHAGRNLRESCKSLPRLAPGQAEMTLGFSLPAKYVIHTNGPLTEDAEQLTGCYVNTFNLLLIHRLRTIAFPCISTGKKGLSRKFAAEVALRTVRQFLEEHKPDVDRVIFCLHNQKDIEIYLRYMQIYFPVEEPDFCIPIT